MKSISSKQQGMNQKQINTTLCKNQEVKPTCGPTCGIKYSILQFCKLNPAFLIIISFIYAILLTKNLNGVIHISLIGLIAIPALIPTIWLSFKFFAKCFIWTMLAILLTWSTLNLPENHYSYKLPNRDCGAIIKARILDMTTSGDGIDWLPLPKMIIANITKFKYSDSDQWQHVTGRALIKFPPTAKNVKYNQKLELSGYFATPEPPIIKGGFNFKEYLLSKNVSHLFVVNHFSSSENIDNNTFWSNNEERLLAFRDALLNKLTSGMEIKYKKMLAAILFGCRQGLNYSSRDQFIQSGVMHIFAISGLHVGMLALTLYLFFAWVPFRTRRLSEPILLFLYVLTTGMQASALRAFLMISIWSIHRSLLRSISPINAIFIAAVIVLLYNPLQLFGAGFQYSFSIATVLTISWFSVKSWFLSLSEHQLWKPDYKNMFQFKIERFRNNSLNSLICSFMAWLTGTGFNLLHRSFFIPGAIFANFIILPFVWLLFFATAINLILLPLQNILHTNMILEFLLKIIDSLSLMGAKYGGGAYVTPPPTWMICIYFIAILLLITSRKKAISLSAIAIILANIIYWHISPDINRNESQIAILHGGESQSPTLIIIPPNKVGTTVINCGSQERVSAIINYLHSNGINSIDTQLFSNSNKSCCNGAWRLFSTMQIRETKFIESYSKSRYAKSAMKSALRAKSEIINREKQLSNNIFDYHSNLPSFNFSYSIENKKNGAKRITLIQNGEKRTLSLLNSNKMRLYTPFK